ncbi:hypothetical protein VST7929_01374 [Vibrio stylophorae]|uniref:DUF3147 family protein n=1 Tax=Vibrio stylophorae TaxID=659351 RepID=A0ABM8ZT79_9VIBR|nr:DUF3147 family protein [Vibrio stylophorae]CAH0533504.1 hypothetical protein VST7929_01374 [Vibrio stylophorae]
MYWLVSKYLITAALVVFISEVAKRSDKLGAFIAALPTVTMLALLWMYIEKQPTEKLANHAFYTFWYVVPSLPMFLVFPWCLPRFGFSLSLLFSVAITVLSFALTAAIAQLFGITLF